jgi:uncharacterized membrane protein YiaA
MKASNKKIAAESSMFIGAFLALIGAYATGLTRNTKEGLMILGVLITGIFYLRDIVKRR